MKTAMWLVVFVVFPIMANGADCNLVKTDICVDGPSTKTISGYPVYEDCWRWEAQYQCVDAAVTDTCQALLDQGCTDTGKSSCVATLPDGSCDDMEKTFQCPDRPASSTSTTVCNSSTFCQNGVGCYDTSYTPSTDFSSAAAMMEAARQGGIYGVSSNGVALFSGDADSCTIKLGGILGGNCCKKSSGGSVFTNLAILSAGASIGKELLDVGSSYMYDALSSTSTLAKGISAAAFSFGFDGTFNPEFSVYGIEVQFSFADGFTMTGFDPYSFAASVAITVIAEWLQCSPEEQKFSLKKGSNLCVKVDSYCSEKIPVIGVCIEKTEDYCCYNSRLAKIVNVQGKAQLGMSLKGCAGFTPDQFSKLDFSKMDLSEFISEIVPKTEDIGSVTGRVTNKVKSYYDQ